MLLILYLAVLITALYWAVKLLLPEMNKPILSRTPLPSNSFDTFRIDVKDNKAEKTEVLLAEKNKTIDLLQKELKIFHAQIRSFDKVKALLDEEILRLREQNRIFRSELGLPTVQSKENSIT